MWLRTRDTSGGSGLSLCSSAAVQGAGAMAGSLVPPAETSMGWTYSVGRTGFGRSSITGAAATWPSNRRSGAGGAARLGGDCSDACTAAGGDVTGKRRCFPRSVRRFCAIMMEVNERGAVWQWTDSGELPGSAGGPATTDLGLSGSSPPPGGLESSDSDSRVSSWSQLWWEPSVEPLSWLQPWEWCWRSEVWRMTLVHWNRCWGPAVCVRRFLSSAAPHWDAPGLCKEAAEYGWVTSTRRGLCGGVRHWNYRRRDDTDKWYRLNNHAYWCPEEELTSGDSCMATAPVGVDSSSEQSEDGVKGLGCLTLKLWVLLCFIMDIRASTASMSPTLRPTDRDASTLPKVRSSTSIMPIWPQKKGVKGWENAHRACSCRFLSEMNICRMCQAACDNSLAAPQGCPFT